MVRGEEEGATRDAMDVEIEGAGWRGQPTDTAESLQEIHITPFLPTTEDGLL